MVVRRASAVAIEFGVPTANTDGSTPADLARVDVYALNGGLALRPDEVLRRGARVGSVNVNPPRDPDAPEADAPRPAAASARAGVEQGSTSRLTDPFTPDPRADPADVRSYVAVGFNKRGRQGTFTPLLRVPLSAAPAAPFPPEVAWDETTITVTWEPAEASDSHVAYHVYAPGEVEARLTDGPIDELRFLDRRIEWGAARCYVIRAVQTVDGLSLESDASGSTCVTLADTFPPAAPVGLNTVAAEGAVNLIWDPNTEKDLAGYLVLRAIAPGSNLVPVTSSPVLETTFRDAVATGSQVMYAVQAVDKAGNVSPMSAPAEVTAR